MTTSQSILFSIWMFAFLGSVECTQCDILGLCVVSIAMILSEFDNFLSENLI